MIINHTLIIQSNKISHHHAISIISLASKMTEADYGILIWGKNNIPNTLLKDR